MGSDVAGLRMPDVPAWWDLTFANQRYFVTVAETGGFTAAAHPVSVSVGDPGVNDLLVPEHLADGLTDLADGLDRCP